MPLPESVRWLPAEDAPPRPRKGWKPLPPTCAGAVLFAFNNADGTPVATGVEGLDADGKRPTRRYRRTCGPKVRGAFHVRHPHGDAGYLAIAEGEVSALAAAWLHGCEAVGLGGTSAYTKWPLDALNGREAILDVDGDPSGRDAAMQLLHRIAQAGRRCTTHFNSRDRDAADRLRTDLNLSTDPADTWARLIHATGGI